MSPEEHYFENLLFAFARGGNDCYDKVVENDPNLEWFNADVKEAIETCAIYVIDCCEWDKDNVNKLLNQ